jgi:hypothetical protein
MSVSGKGLTTKLGGNVVGGIYSADFQEKVDDLDRTTGADGGYTNTDAGCLTIEGTIQGYYDLTNTAYTAVRAGSLLANFAQYATVNGNTAWVFIPSGLVLESAIKGEVRGRLEFSARVRNKGSYTVADV